MQTSPSRVLIVDDDRAFGLLLSEMLAERGHLTRACTEPGEALQVVATQRVDVAVLDLIMPGMGGLELASRLKAASPHTQILILTGYGDIQTAIQGIQHGVVDYLEKASLDRSRLVRAVEDAAARGALVRENERLLSSLKEKNRLLQALQDVSAQLAGEAHRDRVLGSLAKAARDLTSADAARVILFDRTSKDTLVIEMASGDGAETLPGARFEAVEGIAVMVALDGVTVRLAHPMTHPRFSRRSDAMTTREGGFLAAPVRQGNLMGALLVGGHAGGEFSEDDAEVLEALARHAALAVANAQHQEQTVNFFTHICDILIWFLESRDVFYGGHSRAVAALSDMVTRRLGLSADERRDVHFGALLHDIGKVQIDPAVLQSTAGREQVLSVMQEHPALGLDLLKPITLWEGILPLIHSHHERWDGKGYPLGQQAEQIPLGARVIAVADAFDAMVRDTPHGARRTPDEAITELEACAGTQFDPRIVRLFVAEYRARGHQLVY